MAEILIAPIAPPSPAPVPTPSPAPSPTPPQPSAPSKGSTSLVDEFDSMISAPETPEVKAPEIKKPDAKPADTKAPEAKQPEIKKVDPVKEKDPVALRKRLSEIEEKYSKLEQTTANEKRELAEKVAAFEKRKYLTPEQEQQQAALESRSKELEAELYSRDFQQSPDFKSKYETKWQNAYKNALEEVASITIQTEDGAERVANKADFDKVRNAPNGVERRRVAKTIFGEDSNAVIEHVSALKQIEQSANEEVAQRRAEYDTKRNEYLSKSTKDSETYKTTRGNMDRQLSEKYPQYFGDDAEHPELAEKLKSGFTFVDKALNEQDAPVELRAERASIIRHQAAAFPRLVHTLSLKDAKIKEQEEIISKLRGSDPGSASEGGESEPTNKVGGVDSAVAEILGDLKK